MYAAMTIQASNIVLCKCTLCRKHSANGFARLRWRRAGTPRPTQFPVDRDTTDKRSEIEFTAAVNSISHKLTNKSNDRYDGGNKNDKNKVYLECVAAH